MKKKNPVKKVAKKAAINKEEMATALANSHLSRLSLNDAVRLLQGHFLANAKDEVGKLNAKGLRELRERLGMDSG